MLWQDNMDKVPVKDETGLCRDPYSKAIINTNEQAYEDYMSSYVKRRENRRRVEQLQDDVDSLKSDISDIKNLLTKFLENKS